MVRAPNPLEETTMEFVPLVMLLSLVSTFITFLKYVRSGDTNGWVTQLIVWASGVGAVTFVAQTQFASGVPVGDVMLDTLNFASLIFVGLMIGSVASSVYEFKKARDNNDSAAKPKLLTGDKPPQA